MFGFPLLNTNAIITSNYGERINPVTKQQQFHQGIDYKARAGESVRAVAGGTVIHAGVYGTGGLTVRISHIGGFVSEYMHNSKLLVAVGQYVQWGQVIALVGSTGNSTGPHLHFGLLENGKYVNPLDYLGKASYAGNAKEMKNPAEYFADLLGRVTGNEENIASRVEGEVKRVFGHNQEMLGLAIGLVSLVVAGKIIVNR